MREAKAQGADFILTPENTGMMEPKKPLLLEKAKPEAEHPLLPAFADLARETGAWLLLGSIAIKLDPADPARRILGERSPDGEYVRIDPVELHQRIRERLDGLNDPRLPENERITRLTVADRLVGSGLLRWTSPLVDKSLKTPYSRASREAIDALIRHARKLPQELYQSLTWDRGKEMADHKRFTLATDIKVYFCDPQNPWQRGTNENTNGLLRQYFPKGTDLSVYSQAKLDAVARRLNERPRKTLGFETPAERYHRCVASIH